MKLMLLNKTFIKLLWFCFVFNMFLKNSSLIRTDLYLTLK